MIAVLLGEAGIGIEAADAARAAALLATRRFDLVIADPRALVDGGERFGDHLLTRHPALKDRTIFLTADVRPETQAWLRQLGCLYFVKPFPVGDLKAAAATLLAGGSA
jgi:CheY-like chemotaxis protein